MTGLASPIRSEFIYDNNGRQTETWTLKDDGVNFIKNQAQYNAFGEISAKGVDDDYAVNNQYNQIGNLISTNQASGVDNFFDYDLRGLQTHTLVKADLTNAYTTDDFSRHTYVIYDERGQAVQQELPKFTAYTNDINNTTTSSRQTPILSQTESPWVH